MENDSERLQKVATRFGQVGSAPQLEIVDIAPIVSEAVRYFRRRIPYLGQNLDIRERYDLVPPVSINKELIEWVVENVLKNAVDATTDEKGSIDVDVIYKKDIESVMVRVTDNGRGMNAKEARQVFSPGLHHQATGLGPGPDSGQAHRGGLSRRPYLGGEDGTGAGYHDYDDVPDLGRPSRLLSSGGSFGSLEMTAKPPTRSAIQRRLSQQLSTPNQRILWADDEIDMLRPHILYLKSKGYEVVPVANGEDADREGQLESSFDIVLLGRDDAGHGRARHPLRDQRSNTPVCRSS